MVLIGVVLLVAAWKDVPVSSLTQDTVNDGGI